jgi:hypothetical protein
VNARASALLLVLALAVPGPVAGASFTLDQDARREALRVGARSVMVESFDTEWRVAGASGETVTVITPFHRLVLAGRHAAFRNEPVKDNEPEKLLREQRDRLVIWAQLRGAREDFARFYAPRIMLGDRQIDPSFVQNERTAMRAQDGGYLARSVYGFPLKNMTPTARLLLIVRDADGRDVNRFTIDLASMR